MKKPILLFSLVLLITSVSFSQKVHKAKKTPAKETELQIQAVRNAIRQHDQQKFQAAIVIYKSILKECPDCALTMYELGLSYFGNKEYSKAIKTLEEATKYKSSVRANAIRVMASAVDNSGNPKKAVDLYKESLKINDNNAFTHYDIGVTYYRLKDYSSSRNHLKRAIELKPNYTRAHGLLSFAFRQRRFKIPGILASVRFMSLGARTPNSGTVAKYLQSEFKKPKKNEKGNYSINLNLFGADNKEEGDFSSVETTFGLLAAAAVMEEGKELSDAQFFAERLSSLEDLLSNLKGKSNFSKDNYFEFLSDMKSKDYLEVFAHVVLSEADSEQSKKWILENAERVIEFSEWARSYEN